MMPLSLSMRLNPNGPITAPEIIRPKRCGIFILLRMIGANRIINSINRNFNTGLVSGKVSSVMLTNIILSRCYSSRFVNHSISINHKITYHHIGIK
jgi:hypothetical protein